MDTPIRSRLLQQLLAQMPEEWLGTTFRNTNLLGREGFSANLKALLAAKAEDPQSTITKAELVALGEAEDYLRVATNVSTTLEAVLAFERGLDPARVFSFASTTMPVVAVCLTAGADTDVHLFHGAAAPALTAARQKQLALLGGRLSCHAGPPPAQRPNGIVLISDGLPAPWAVDGVVGESLLYVAEPSRIDPAQILVIRKRFATPATTPRALVQLHRLAGLLLPAKDVPIPPPAAELGALHAHLQAMCGTPVDAACLPALFTAGLPALGALWAALCAQGGADVLMCSTAYGGSSQVTDLLEARAAGARLRKHTFHIQGDAPVNRAIADALRRLLDGAGISSKGAAAYPVNESRERADTPAPWSADASRGGGGGVVGGVGTGAGGTGGGGTGAGGAAAQTPPALLPTTLVFVEVPSNPDMKVADLKALATDLLAFGAKANTRVLLLVDTTFAPASRAMRRLREAAPTLPAICFVSCSKAVSRGLTTAGALIPNHAPEAAALVRAAAELGAMLDVGAKPEQLRALVANHRGVEERCAAAYQVAATLGKELCAAVEAHAGRPMRLAFVTPEQAAAGFSSSTFSFNLPPPAGASAAQAAALAQRFVDALTAPRSSLPLDEYVQWMEGHGLAPRASSASSAAEAEEELREAKEAVARRGPPPRFKPCVSFGQDNGTVYCTVPATSTQGAVKAEDKAKQAVGGVQLVRLSFPPTLDTAAAARVLRDAVVSIYGPPVLTY